MDAAVCGIDPGLGTTGYAVLRAGAVIDAGVCRFDADRPLAERLVAVEADMAAILAEHSPDVVAVEQLYSHYKHPRTAILMGHARGVILLCAARLGIPVRSYSVTQIKRYLTGNGRATKSQMQRAVALTLGLQSAPEPADVADALAIAMCGAADVSRRGYAAEGIEGSRGPAPQQRIADTEGKRGIAGNSAARAVTLRSSI